MKVYAWETKSQLSGFVEDRGKLGLPARVKDARGEESYRLAADSLRKKIFSGHDKKNEKQAAEAEEFFRDLVRRKNGDPIVFVRMRNEKGHPVYLPLGILAATSENPILDKRIILVQPLPRERYPGGTHPVGTWTSIIPKTLEGPDLDNVKTALSNFTTSWDFINIQKFLETVTSVQDSKPEGLLLLVHQGGGYLWFTKSMEPNILIEDIKREFPPGSVAILSACSVAAAIDNNQAILKELNKNGIDAMIISPFPVDANYGTMLAIYFARALEEAREELTVAEIFNKAVTKTAEYFKDERISFRDTDLEFIIAGDYRIKIAPSK